MSFINFNHQRRRRRRGKDTRSRRNEAYDRKRYKAWSRRKPKCVENRHIPMPDVSAAAASPPPQIKHKPKPTKYRNATHKKTTTVYLESHVSENREAYEWVGEGCLIGVREIYINLI